MNSFEFNKIFAALLVAGIVAFIAGFAAEEMTHAHMPKEFAYNIEGSDGGGDAGGGGKQKAAEPILALIAAADIAKGEKLSRACAACHSFDKGGPMMTGPNLWDVLNRDKGGVSGFAYSEELAAMPGKWGYAELNSFLWKPKAYVASTKMNFIGLKKPEERAAMIAWLRTKADSPAALPTEGEVAAEAAANAPAAEEAAATSAPAAESVPAPAH